MNTAELSRRELIELAPDEIPDDTRELVPVKNNFQKWVIDNACLIAYLAVLNIITWAVIIYSASH